MVYLTVKFKISTQIRIKGRKLFLRKNSTDYKVFYQVFIQEIYKIGKLCSEPEVVIDGGANVGFSSLYFASTFPTATVVSIEPDEGNFAVLKKNTNGEKRIEAMQKAIWSKNKQLVVLNNEGGEWGKTVKESDDTNEKNVVTSISINEIVDQFDLKKIDIVKLDIEGAEKEVFEKDLEWLEKTSLIIIEIHDNIFPGLSKKIKSILASNNFSYFSKGENSFFFKENVFTK